MAVPRLPKLGSVKRDPKDRLQTMFGTTGFLDSRGPLPEEVPTPGTGILSALTANPDFLQKQFPGVDPRLIQLLMLAPHALGPIRGSITEPVTPPAGPRTAAARVPGGTPQVAPPRELPSLEVGPMFDGLGPTPAFRNAPPTMPAPPPEMTPAGSKFPALQPQPIDPLAHAAADFSAPSVSSYGKGSPAWLRQPLPDVQLPPNWSPIDPPPASSGMAGPLQLGAGAGSPMGVRPPLMSPEGATNGTRTAIAIGDAQLRPQNPLAVRSPSPSPGAGGASSSPKGGGFQWGDLLKGAATVGGSLGFAKSTGDVIPSSIDISNKASKLKPGEEISAPMPPVATSMKPFDFLSDNGGKSVAAPKKAKPKKISALNESDGMEKPDMIGPSSSRGKSGGALSQIDPALLKLMMGL